jgi:hypothetical protein
MGFATFFVLEVSLARGSGENVELGNPLARIFRKKIFVKPSLELQRQQKAHLPT